MKLSALKNLGKTMERKLTSVGIHDSDELTALGSQEAFVLLKAEYPEVCVVHLYALESALRGIAFSELPQDIRNDLKDFYRKLDSST